MSNTDNTTKEWRGEGSSERRDSAGAIRHVAIKLTEGGQWQVIGHILPDGRLETRDATVLSGIGFAARPAAGANAEAIMVFPGGAGNPVLIASRDEDARRAVAELAQNSTIMFNRLTIILIKPDGTVEIRNAGGTAHELAFKSELNSLRSFVANQFSGAGHVHGVSGAATNSTVPVGIPPIAFPGTTVLKAQ